MAGNKKEKNILCMRDESENWSGSKSVLHKIHHIHLLEYFEYLKLHKIHRIHLLEYFEYFEFHQNVL